MLKILFLLLSLLALVFFYFGTGNNKRLISILIIWQAIVGLFAFINVFINKPILFPLVILGSIIVSIICYNGVEIKKIKPVFLYGIHALRLPVEIGLYFLYSQGKVPKIMTFEGLNFDIIFGISAFFFLITPNVNRQLVKVWNVMGLFSLVLIVLLAIFSSPSPIQLLSFDQPNIAVLEFPFCFLPSCIVPAVFLSHLFLLRDYKCNLS